MTAPQDTTDVTASKVEPDATAEAAQPTDQNQQAPEAQGEPAQADKPEGEGTEQEGEKAKAEEPSGAPEAYSDFTLPEGVELDETVLGDFKTQAKELNLGQAQAQSVVDLGIKLQQSWTDKANAEIDKTIAGWVETAKTDPDLGGEALEKNLALAKSVADRFGSETFKTELLEKYRLGDHPEFIRFCRDVAKAVSEDSLVSATGEAKPTRAFGEGWYDNPTSKTPS